MDAKAARSVLVEDGFSFEEEVIRHANGSYVYKDGTCDLLGVHVAKDFEAIACWLRDPKAVSEAS